MVFSHVESFGFTFYLNTVEVSGIEMANLNKTYMVNTDRGKERMFLVIWLTLQQFTTMCNIIIKNSLQECNMNTWTHRWVNINSALMRWFLV